MNIGPATQYDYILQNVNKTILIYVFQYKGNLMWLGTKFEAIVQLILNNVT